MRWPAHEMGGHRGGKRAFAGPTLAATLGHGRCHDRPESRSAVSGELRVHVCTWGTR